MSAHQQWRAANESNYCPILAQQLIAIWEEHPIQQHPHCRCSDQDRKQSEVYNSLMHCQLLRDTLGIQYIFDNASLYSIQYNINRRKEKSQR